MLRVVLASLLVMVARVPANAQQLPTDDPVATAPVHLGVVALAPRVGLSNLGVDNNVFNQAVNPKSDATGTVNLGTDLWMRTQRGLLTVNGTLDIVRFNEYTSENSVNSRASGLYEYRFNRLRPYVSARTLNTRERPGYEIDVRARRYENEVAGGADVRVASKTFVGGAYNHVRYTYDGDAVFGGAPLNQTLNRSLDGLELNWRQLLTSQTTWRARGRREWQRFTFEPRRNSNSTRLRAGFDLGQFALIRGNAFVGYLNLAPAEGGAFVKYSGPTADIDVTYTAPTRTRLTLGLDRDVQYSSDSQEVYYLQTGWTLTVTQRLFGRWDAQLQGGHDRLSYEGIALRPDGPRVDLVDRFGGGIGYQLKDRARMSFDVRSIQRRSPILTNNYNSLRAGFSVNYGL